MKKIKTAEKKFFELLANHFGGTKRLSELLGVDFWIVNNWKARGFITAENVVHASKKLGISPLVLNNKQFHYISDWKKLISELKIFDDATKESIIKLPVEFK